MAETILFGLAEEVLKKLGSAEIASAWGFKTQLQKLEDTMNTLKYVLLDAEEKQPDSRDVRRWLERLSTVVYAADNLLDEFNTVAARKQLKGGHKLTKEVCTFFSHSNQVALAFNFSRKIKKIREDLKHIKEDGKWFNFVPRSLERGSAMSRKRDQTTSYVDEDNVVGREDDKERILKMLLESSSSGHNEVLPVISIVGMGGMGKTTLAQLVYDDPQVKEYFDLRLWVCVSDVFDNKVIIEKLLKSATNEDHPNLHIQQLHGRLRNKVDGKKCLFVLDDFWNHDRLEWVELLLLLKTGRKGSNILVTTRSREVARIVRSSSAAYDLQELSEDKSWKLFEKMAFINPEEAQQKSDLVKIGKEIIKKCRGVPLAVKTVGCLLYGKEEEEWLSIKDKSLAKILDNQNNIMDILKLSYHHLSSPLKNCFAYCALFPKDYQFDKEMLIDLWIAEGFIVLPSDDDRSLDEVAEDYFHTLLQRGFFQILRNIFEDIYCCKMHDFMHDLAEEVAGVKCKVAKSHERNFDGNSVHLSLAYQLTPSWEIPNGMLNMKQLRTFLLPEQTAKCSPSRKSISLLTRFRSLRVLDLNELDLKSLPSSIGKLIHLRYLSLCHTPIEKLSDSITDLWNLQTLKLCSCNKLRELPANMRKLINLRRLDVVLCYGLSHLPSGLGGLTSLSILPVFIVDSRYKATAKLGDLKNLNKLRGTLKIDIKCNLENSRVEAREAELSNKSKLTILGMKFPSGEGVSDGEAGDCKHDEAVLQGLKPPSNIKSLRIEGYRGDNVPRWARMDTLSTTLPKLVQITLEGWKRCQQLPDFSQLRFLKFLTLRNMERVEYIESNDVSGVPSSSTSTIFFPSLEELFLINMENLKGWWKEEDASGDENECSESERASNELAARRFPTRFMQFSKLSQLRIINCPKLRLLPICPNVENLALNNTNETLSVLKMATTSSTCSSSSSSTGTGLKLKKLRIDNAEDLLSLPNHCLLHPSSLNIDGDNKLVSTERLGDVFKSLSSSLRSLNFVRCKELRSIAKGLEHLTNLETLSLYGCEGVDIWEDEEGMPWKALNTSLRSLELSHLPKLVGLPRGLQHLSNLRSLSLSFNAELEELPEWMSCLTSLEYVELFYCPKLRCLPEAFRQLTTLNRLEIIGCPELKERCQEGPNGIDWPKIQHIPHLSIHDY